MLLPLFSIALPEQFIKLNSFTDETEIPPSSACPSNTQSASWSVNIWDDWTVSQWDRGQMPKEKTIKCKGGRKWIYSAYYDITRGTCANNRPLSLDLDVFVQNYTEALCSQTALETALMFIQIPSKCRIMVTLISSLIPNDRTHTEKIKNEEKVFKIIWNVRKCSSVWPLGIQFLLQPQMERETLRTSSSPPHSILSAFFCMEL